MLLGTNISFMNVAREFGKHLILPAAMILFGVLLWTGTIDRMTALVVMVLFIVVLAFRAGRLSKEIW